MNKNDIYALVEAKLTESAILRAAEMEGLLRLNELVGRARGDFLAAFRTQVKTECCEGAESFCEDRIAQCIEALCRKIAEDTDYMIRESEKRETLFSNIEDLLGKMDDLLAEAGMVIFGQYRSLASELCRVLGKETFEGRLNAAGYVMAGLHRSFFGIHFWSKVQVIAAIQGLASQPKKDFLVLSAQRFNDVHGGGFWRTVADVPNAVIEEMAGAELQKLPTPVRRTFCRIVRQELQFSEQCRTDGGFARTSIAFVWPDVMRRVQDDISLRSRLRNTTSIKTSHRAEGQEHKLRQIACEEI